MAFFFSPLSFTIPLSPFRAQGQTDKHKTIWERSRETLETADSRAVNKKERIHGVSGEEFMGGSWQEGRPTDRVHQ